MRIAAAAMLAGALLSLLPPSPPGTSVAASHLRAAAFVDRSAGPATRLCVLADARIGEASGLAEGRRWPGVLYVQNDSGDSARFFALDRTTGRTRAEFRVPGARNVDWEDLSVGPDRRGVASVWLADIGDNADDRSGVTVYRVDEPAPPPGRAGAAASEPLTTTPAEVWRLRYPDGAHDAESMLLDPVRHRLYLATKSLLGHTEVFAVPAGSNAGRLQTLVRVATVDFGFTGTPGGPNVIGELTATGASMSADGTLLAIRTYTDAYLWPVRNGDVAAALRAPPTRLPLPAQPQGEGIALGAGYLLVDSEGTHSAVYRVPLPRTAPATSSSATTATSSPATTSTSRPVVQTTAAAAGHRSWRRYQLPAALGASALGAAALGSLMAFRRAGRTRSCPGPANDRP